MMTRLDAVPGLAGARPSDPVRLRRALRRFLGRELGEPLRDRRLTAEGLLDFAAKLDVEARDAATAARQTNYYAFIGAAIVAAGIGFEFTTFTVIAGLAVIVGGFLTTLLAIVSRGSIRRDHGRQIVMIRELRLAAARLAEDRT